MPETKDDPMDALWKDIQKIETYYGIDVTKDESPEINKIREQIDYVRKALILIYSQLVALDPDKDKVSRIPSPEPD